MSIPLHARPRLRNRPGLPTELDHVMQYTDTAKEILKAAINYNWLIDASYSKTSTGNAVILSLRKDDQRMYVVFVEGKFTRAFLNENYIKLANIHSAIKGINNDQPQLPRRPRRNASPLHDRNADMPVLWNNNGD